MLQRFHNQHFLGNVRELSSLPMWEGEYLHLIAEVSSGMLSVYIGSMDTEPLLHLAVNKAAGQIGFRAFHSPSKVKGLKITSPSLRLDFSRLDELLAQANALNPDSYIEKGYSSLMNVVSRASAIDRSTINQIQVDD